MINVVMYRSKPFAYPDCVARMLNTVPVAGSADLVDKARSKCQRTLGKGRSHALVISQAFSSNLVSVLYHHKGNRGILHRRHTYIGNPLNTHAHLTSVSGFETITMKLGSVLLLAVSQVTVSAWIGRPVMEKARVPGVGSGGGRLDELGELRCYGLVFC